PCSSRSSTAFAIEVPKTLRAPVKGKSAPSRGDGDSSAGATAGGRDEVATTGRVARPFPTQSSMATRARLSVAAGLRNESPRPGVHLRRQEPSPLQGRRSNRNRGGWWIPHGDA